jgi:hypothetical protein
MEVRSWLTGSRGICLPFTDECAPLGPSAEDCRTLIQDAIALGSSRGWKYLEVRGGAAFVPDAPPSTSFWGHRLDLTAGESALLTGTASSVRRAIRKAQQSRLRVEFSQDLAAMQTFYRLHCLTRKRHGVPPQPWRFFAKIHEHVIANDLGWVAVGYLNPATNESATANPTSNCRSGFTPRPPSEADESRRKAAPTRCAQLAVSGRSDDVDPGKATLSPSASTKASSFALRSSADKSAHEAQARLQAPTPIAAAVYFRSGQTVLYKFGASDETQQHLRANNLVMWEAIRRFAQEGFAQLDFGRTSLDNEGLRQFKLGWGAQEHRIDYLRYDFTSRSFITAPDRSSGRHTKVFQKLPVPLLRFVGRLLYRHIG